MQIDEYLAEYAQFYNEFFPKATDDDIERKLAEEFFEYMDAETNEQELDELVDLMNIAIYNVYRRVSIDPLHAGFTKLRRTAEKYRRANDSNSQH